MRKPFNVIIERDSAGYDVAGVPELQGCHTQAKSLDTLIERVQEEIELYLEVKTDAGDVREFIGVQRVWVEA